MVKRPWARRTTVTQEQRGGRRGMACRLREVCAELVAVEHKDALTNEHSTLVKVATVLYLLLQRR